MKTGVNDLLTLYPEIAAECLGNPSEILATSVKKCDWKCSLCGKEWSSPPKSRTNHIKPSVGCPDCSRKAAMIKRSKKVSFADEFPELVPQMVDQNLANVLTYSSHEEVEWHCENGFDHTYPLSINKRVYGRGCPYCSFREVLIGFNNLSAVRPDLSDEVIDKNDLALIANSAKTIVWHHFVEEVEHVWDDSPLNRAYYGQQCKTCTGRQVQKGVNDFKTVFLKGAGLEWSSKNKKKPYEITASSDNVVTLVCNKHSNPNIMSDQVRNFAIGKRVCQDCKMDNEFVSKREQEVYDYICSFLDKDKVEQSVRRFKSKGIYEIDILVDNKVAIDFNGHYWHQEGIFKPVGYHAAKRKAVEDLGFVFIEVEEMDWINNKETIKESLSHTIIKEIMKDSS